MSRQSDLIDRLSIEGGSIPSNISDLRIILKHNPNAIARGIPARVGAEIEQTLQATAPLFASGFAGADNATRGASEGLSAAVLITPTGVQIDISGAAHGPLLSYLILRVIETHSQTPDSAYQFLLDAMDGDEEMARAAFNPLSLSDDISAILVQARGVGAATLDIGNPPVRGELVPLLATLQSDQDRLVLSMPPNAGFGAALENGLLTLAEQGSFQAFGAQAPTPEIFMQDGKLVVDGWDADMSFLAEFARVVAGGTMAGIAISEVD